MFGEIDLIQPEPIARTLTPSKNRFGTPTSQSHLDSVDHETSRDILPPKPVLARASPLPGRNRSAPRTALNSSQAESGRTVSSPSRAPAFISSRAVSAGPVSSSGRITPSRREQQRRSHIVAMADISGTTEELESAEISAEEVHRSRQKRIIKSAFKVEWRGIFTDLFKAGDYEALDYIRKGRVTASHSESEGPVSFPSSSSSSGHSRRTRPDVWADAENAWYKIEKKLRKVVSASIAKERTADHPQDQPLTQFLGALEVIVLFYLNTTQVVPQIPEAVSRKLRRGLGVSVDEDGSLCIPLKDCAFDRLLVHTCAQFYGVASSTNKENGLNVVCLKFPRAKSAVAAHDISLVAYLKFGLSAARSTSNLTVDSD